MPIFSTLRIINLDIIIAIFNIIRAIIPTITIITIIITINYREEIIMFVIKKLIILINI